MKMMVAACSRDPKDLGQLLAYLEDYDAELVNYIQSGLAVFDEHNVDGNYLHIHTALAMSKPHETPVFRVVDEFTRDHSLNPVKAGLVIFNLLDRRIVQVVNSYAEIRRMGVGRVRDRGIPTSRRYRYRLPPSWRIVP
jgi:hypothetical protein